ncbi:hypothetical protein HHI36_006714 [Cryptolaemus montrouzieri]|uniref:ZAD domain-containing protein n=1 Tax=Cryptolaemus montrouzieri TaxID=559131 RepID=A0ABD2NXZ8_9CUCU
MDMSVYLAAPLQLDKICRACLSVKGDMRPLFGACLDEMLLSFASLEVKEGDGLPHLMCVQCVLQCSRAYTFKQLCEKSDSILRQYLTPEFQTQLTATLVDQNPFKEEDQQVLEQAQEMHFTAESLSNVIIEDGIATNFVAYNEEDGTIQVIATANPNDLQEATVECLKDEDASLKPDSKQKYQCSKCTESFPLKIDLKIHLMSHPKDLDHVCEVCKRHLQKPEFSNVT